MKKEITKVPAPHIKLISYCTELQYARRTINGITVGNTIAGWFTRPVKSAKESAEWMEHVLQLKDAAFMKQLREEDKFPTLNLKPKTQVDMALEYRAWRKSLEPKWFFDSSDKAYEISRRKLANKQAIEQIGHPAAKSAAVFCSGICSAAQMLGIDTDVLVEKGGSRLTEEIGNYNKLIDAVEDNIDHQRSLINYVWAISSDRPELVDAVRDMEPELKELKDQLKQFKAERANLGAALKELREGADDATRALIDARLKVAAKKIKIAKEKKVGRQINLAEKAQLKGFSIMSFTIGKFIPKKIKDLRANLVEWARIVNDIQTDGINHIDIEFIKEQISKVMDAVKSGKLTSAESQKATEWAKAHTAICDTAEESAEFSDDQVKTIKANVFNAYMKLYKTAKTMLDEGVSFEADSRYALINSARQSQLSDVIDVPYGKTTDMMVSLEHTMANFIPKGVVSALDEDPEKAQRNLDGLETVLMEIVTKNGLTVKFQNENGIRKLHYKFWNANNSALKVGKCYILSDEAHARAKEVAQAGLLDEDFNKIPTNGSDMLKWWSYATTPGCPLEYNGEYITVNDVIVVKSIDILRKFKNVMFFDKDGNTRQAVEGVVPRTAYDGQMFIMVPIPSQQMRGGFAFKGYGVCCAYEDGTTMVDEIAKLEGRQIPELIEDIDGNMREWRKAKIICTADCWKWMSYGLSYSEYCKRMTKLSEKYPTANVMYTARIADATEESKRRLTRQSTQQFMFATDEQIEDLVAKSVNKVNRLRTFDGIIRKMAGLDKDEAERTDFERLIEVAPDILNDSGMKRYIEDCFNRDVAEAAVRPTVDGIYPYICEDPIPFFKIVFWKEDPNKIGLGYLAANKVNIPNAETGKRMYIVRYPNNFVCGMIGINKNHPIYRCVGNTMVLGFDGYWLIRADGDTDGDEACAIFNQVVIDMMEEAIRRINPPLIVFPHQKLGKDILATEEERAFALAKAMVTANKFGPAVGQNSNLSTKFMQQAAVAWNDAQAAKNAGDADARKKALFRYKAALRNAVVSHIAAIIAIDLAKTGEMPAWLQNMLDKVQKFAKKQMPWNQRFCKDNKMMPWYSESWDDKTQPESDAVVDRAARKVISLTDALNYKAPTGNEFDYKSILCDRLGLYVQGSKGILDAKQLQSLEARNYREKNNEGDDDYRIIVNLREGKAVSFAEMLRFFWRNQANLVYRLGGSHNVSDNSAQINEYLRFVHDIMVDFGSNGGNKTFLSKTEDIRRKSNIYHAVEMAFSEKNGVGVKAESEEEKLSAQASFKVFVLKVFAYDLYNMVCDKKGIVDRYIRPRNEERPTVDVEDFDLSVLDDCPAFSIYDEMDAA